MSKFDDTFQNVDEFSTFQLDIISDNAETLTFDDLDGDTVRRVVELLEEATKKPEPEDVDAAE